MDMQNTQNIRILLFIILAVTSMMLFFDIVLTPKIRIPSDRTYRAEEGVLDLRGWDINELPFIPLNGEWEFFWNQLLESGEFEGVESAFAEVPGTWTDSETGYATYRLHLITDPLERNLALRNQSAGTAMNILVDGEQVVAIGHVSDEEDTAVPAYRTGVTRLSSLEGVTSFDIIVQISNYDYRIGGLWRQIWFGDYETLYRWHWGAEVRTVILFSALFVMGLYHFAIFLLRSKDRQYFALSIFCLLLSLRALFPTQYTIMHLFPHLPFHILVRLEYLTFYLALPTATLLFSIMYREEFHAVVVRIVVTISFLFAFSVLISPPLAFTRYVFLFYGFSALSILYIVFAILRAAIHRRSGAVFTLIGTVILAAATINDNFYSSFIIHTDTYIETGMILFIFFQALALSIRLTEAFTRVEVLSSSLTELNAGLEQEVDKRAEELKAAYESVKKLELVRFADEERKQLGRDLHDGLGQSVHALELLGEGLRLSRHDPEVTEQKLEAILEVNGEIRDYLYTILEELYPVNIGKLGLVAGIETLAEKISSYHGISVDLDCPQGEVPVNDVLANDLYLIISEAVNNAIRHADPSRIRVVLRYDEESISLHVVNDGVGTHTSVRDERNTLGGRGLKIMEYRTVSHGGTFSAQYQPSGRFSVISEIPLVQDGKDEEVDDDNSHDA